MGGGEPMHNYTCPRCRMNHRQDEWGICRYCLRACRKQLQTVPKPKVYGANLDAMCAYIREKDAAGKTLTPIEYAIARVWYHSARVVDSTGQVVCQV